MPNNLQKYYYDLELLRQLHCQINADWAIKWAANFGGETFVLAALSSKDKFYDALKADIFDKITKQKGQRIAKACIIEKDTIENHLNQRRQSKTTDEQAQKPKPFLRDASRQAYAYYLGYESYGAFVKKFDFETLRQYYTLVPQTGKELVVLPTPTDLALVRIDEQGTTQRIITRGENATFRQLLLSKLKQQIQPVAWALSLLLLYQACNSLYEWYMALPLFTAEQLAGVKFRQVFSTNTSNKATILYAYDVRSLQLRPDTDTVQVYFEAANNSNYLNGNKATRLSFIDTVQHDYYKPFSGFAQLYVKNKLVAITPVYIPTGGSFVGWAFGQIANDRFVDRLAYYDSICTKGTAHIAKADVEPRIQKSYLTTYDYVDDFKFAIDTCTFAFRLKNPEGYAINANDIVVNILGKPQYKEGKISQEGLRSSYYASPTNIFYLVELQDKGYQPKSFAAFAKEMQQRCNDWKVMKFEFRYPQFTVYIDDKIYIKGNYEKPMGKLGIVSFAFKGSGMADWVQITGKSGRELYFEDFGGAAAW